MNPKGGEQAVAGSDPATKGGEPVPASPKNSTSKMALCEL